MRALFEQLREEGVDPRELATVDRGVAPVGIEVAMVVASLGVVSRDQGHLLAQHTFGAGVDVHRVSTQESDEPHARAFGELDGETRGGGYRREQRNLGHERFLYDLEARSSADHEDASFEREAIREQRCPDDLVDGVVSLDKRNGNSRAPPDP